MVGGGNVAIDAARVAKRLGARTVTVVYRRSEQEMPAYADEIQGARDEGIAFAYLTAPVRILASGRPGQRIRVYAHANLAPRTTAADSDRCPWKGPNSSSTAMR